MKNIFLFLYFGFVLTYSISCKKSKEPSQFSDWKVNGTEYRSNNVTIITTKGAAVMECRESEGFAFVWLTSTGFPRGFSGSYPSKIERPNGSGNPREYIYVYHNGHTYIVSSHEDKYYTISQNPPVKVEISVPPTWFVKIDNEADSILVEGVFQEP
ncbi:MAG: hypothetical protein JNM21_07585 [Taibaiella sp.]|nr:hypothetical protein [Taibaiella sp.]